MSLPAPLCAIESVSPRQYEDMSWDRGAQISHAGGGHQTEPGDLRLPVRIQGGCVLLPSWSTSKRCGFKVRGEKRKRHFAVERGNTKQMITVNITEGQVSCTGHMYLEKGQVSSTIESQAPSSVLKKKRDGVPCSSGLSSRTEPQSGCYVVMDNLLS